jgi:O-antigen ligase
LAVKPRSDRSRRAIVSLLAALLTLPALIPYHVLPTTDFFSNVAALLLSLMLTLFVVVRGRRQLVVHASPLFVPLIGLILLIAVQNALIRFPYSQDAVIPVFVLFTAVGVLHAGLALRGDSRADVINVIAWSAVVGALLHAAWVVVEIFAPEVMSISRIPGQAFRTGGALAQPNQLAAFLMWGLLGLFYLGLQKRIGPALLAAIAIVISVALAMTGSRTTYLFMIVVWPLLAMLLWKGRVIRRPWRLLLVPVAYLLVELAVRRLLLLGALESPLREVEIGTLAVRLALWNDAWRLFLSDPLVGVGWGQYALARTTMTAPTLVELNAMHPHNLLLALLSESGLVGTILVVIPVALWGWKLFRATNLDPSQVFLLAMVTVIGVYSMTEFPLWLAYFLLPTALMMGLLCTSPLTIQVTSSIFWLKAAAALSALLALGMAVMDYRRVESAHIAYRYPQQVSYVERLRVLDLAWTTLFQREGEQLYVRLGGLSLATLPIDSNIALRVYESFPAPEYAVIRAAHLSAMGRNAEAVEVIRRTCAWAPWSCPKIVDLLRRELGTHPEIKELVAAFDASLPY